MIFKTAASHHSRQLSDLQASAQEPVHKDGSRNALIREIANYCTFSRRHVRAQNACFLRFHVRVCCAER